MATRTAGAAVVASVLTSALLVTSWGAAAQAAKRLDTCFGAEPTHVLDDDVDFAGTEDNEVVLGGDEVRGNGGDDLICDARTVYGGEGNDRIRVLDGGTAWGNAGDDEFISLSFSSDALVPTLFGGSGHDAFWGGPLPEVVYGGGGGDEARTGGGDDFVDLGGGNDTGYGGPDDDRFTAGKGDDYVDGGTGYDTVDGGPGRDRCRAVESHPSCPPVR